jgi:hypothetical protein
VRVIDRNNPGSGALSWAHIAPWCVATATLAVQHCSTWHQPAQRAAILARFESASAQCRLVQVSIARQHAFVAGQRVAVKPVYCGDCRGRGGVPAVVTGDEVGVDAIRPGPALVPHHRALPKHVPARRTPQATHNLNTFLPLSALPPYLHFAPVCFPAAQSGPTCSDGFNGRKPTIAAVVYTPLQ